MIRKSEDIRFAVIGCGSMGPRHAEVIRATAGAQLVCMHDKTPEKAERAVLEEDVCKTFDEVLDRDDVDAVVIALPTGLHAEYGIAAAKAGKHVIIERPIATNVADGKKLIDECRKSDVQCAVISQHRFANGPAALWCSLQEGLLGKPVMATAAVKLYRTDAYYTDSSWHGRIAGEGGGVLINQAVHYLDMLIWMFGKPVEVFGMTQRSRDVLETEDVGVAIIRFPDNVLASIEASTSAYPGFEELLEVHGPIGSCVVKKGRVVYWKIMNERPVPDPPYFDPPTPGLDPRLALFQRQYRNIIAAIKGRAKLLVQPDEALTVISTIQSIYDCQKKKGIKVK